MTIKDLTIYDFLALIFFLILFPLLATNSLDGDFFWHIKTGEWIFDHFQLPDSDPFSYMVHDKNPFRPDDPRVQVILQRYWLAQLVYYGIWSLAGMKGIVLFRAIFLSATLLIVYLWARKNSNGPVAFLLLVLAGGVFPGFIADRPTLFTYLFTVVTLILLDHSCRRENGFSRTIYFLPCIMLVWSNMHGGYLLGIGLIAIYLTCAAGLRLFKKRNLFDRKTSIILFTSIVVSFLNPTGVRTITNYFNKKLYYTHFIQENVSPIILFKKGQYNFPYWILLIAIVLVILWQVRKIPIETTLVLTAISVLSITASRHMIFIALAAPLAAQYIPGFRQRTYHLPVGVLLVVFFGVTHSYATAFDFGKSSKFFPRKAVQFLNQVSPQGRIFNFYDWGSYLIMYAPGYQVFTDSRGLVEEHVGIHHNVMRGDRWEEAFKAYDINTVLIPGTNSFFSKKVHPLIRELAYRADNWHLVYFDETAVIFIRSTPQNAPIIARYSMPKWKINEHIQMRYSWLMNKKSIGQEEFMKLYSQ